MAASTRERRALIQQAELQVRTLHYPMPLQGCAVLFIRRILQTGR